MLEKDLDLTILLLHTYGTIYSLSTTHSYLWHITHSEQLNKLGLNIFTTNLYIRSLNGFVPFCSQVNFHLPIMAPD